MVDICSDKTGTLTQNRMTVVTGWLPGGAWGEGQQLNKEALRPEILQHLVDGIAINSTAHLERASAGAPVKFVGAATECAMLLLIESLGYDYKALREQAPIVQIYPFKSAKKRMSVV